MKKILLILCLLSFLSVDAQKAPADSRVFRPGAVGQIVTTLPDGSIGRVYPAVQDFVVSRNEAYQIGDLVKYNGKIYEAILQGTTAPDDVYSTPPGASWVERFHEDYAFIPESKIQHIRKFQSKVNGGDPVVWFLGDSKTESRSNFFSFVTQAFSSLGYNVIEGSQGTSSANPFPEISGISIASTGAWSSAASTSGLNNTLISGALGATVTYTIGDETTINEVVVAATGSFSVESFNDATSLGSTPYTGGPTAHLHALPATTTSFTITATTAVTINGIMFRSGDASTVEALNLGRSGSGADNWVDVMGDATWQALFQPYLPDLVIIDLGTNDATRTDLLTFKTNYESIVDYFLSEGVEIVMIAPPPRGLTVVSETEDMNAVIFEMSNEKETAFLSYYTRYNSLADMQAIGATGDDVHFLPDFGQENVSWIIGNIVKEASSPDVNYALAFQVESAINTGDWDDLIDVGFTPKIIKTAQPNGPALENETQHAYPQVIRRNSDNLIQYSHPTDANAGSLAYRTKTGGVFSNWRYVQTGIVYDASGVSDWNDITTPGLYYASASGTITNGPGLGVTYHIHNSTRLNSSGSIEVLIQTARPETPLSSPTYTRAYDGTTWTEWEKSYTGRAYGTEIIDWNNVTSEGLYENIVLGNQPNGPTGTSNFFFVKNEAQRAGRIFQWAFPYGTHSAIYYRTYDGSTWSEWVQPGITQASIFQSPSISSETDWNAIIDYGNHAGIMLGSKTNGPGGSVFYTVHVYGRGTRRYQEARRYGNTGTAYYFRTTEDSGATWTAWESMVTSASGGADNLGDHTATEDIKLGGFKATGAADGTSATDLTTLQQVQALLGETATTTTTTDASGDITITHSLGAIPGYYQITVDGTGGWVGNPHTATSTTFKVRVTDGAGAALVSTAVIVYSQAKL